MDVVISFSIGKSLGVEADSGVFASMILLCEYSPCGEGGSVYLKEEWFCWVRLKQGRVGEDSIYKGV